MKFSLEMLNNKYISVNNNLIYTVKGCEVSKKGLLVRVEKVGSSFEIKLPEQEFFKVFKKVK